MKLRLTQKTVDALDPENPVDFWDSELTGFGVRMGTISKYYALQYTTKGGKRTTMKIGDAVVMPLAVARSEAKKVLGDVESGADPNAAKAEARAETLSLGEYISAHYAPWLESQTRTGKNIIRFTTNWLAPHMDKPLKDLGTLDLERIRKAMKAKGNTSATCNRLIEHAGAMLRRATEWGMFAVMPKMPKRDQLDNGKIRTLSDDQRQRLFVALRSRDAEMRTARERHVAWATERGYKPVPEYGTYADHLEPAVLLALNTGARRAEVLGCMWREMDMERMIWTVPASRAKSGKSRIIPLNQAAREVIAYMKSITGGSSWLFTNEAGDGPILDLRKSFDKVLETAGIEDFSWHSLRHAFISDIVESGVDLETCRSLSGHSSLEILQQYTHSTDQRRKAAVAALDHKNAPADNIVNFLVNTANSTE